VSSAEIKENQTPAGKKHRKGYRPDLEGLRAVAVLLVVFYHAGISFLPGGYVGVDVFYVLSGFFITGLLVKEAEASGKISFKEFYARRGRRLIPAATLVIVVTAVVSWFAYAPLRLTSFGWDAVTSSLNVANFRYAFQATDYLTQGNDASPFLHFWSLSVEEQFYWVWPLLIMLAAGVWGRKRQIQPGRLLAVLLVVTVVSFIACVWLTQTNQPWAFFMLPTRAWELAIGGIVAIVIAKASSIPAGVRDVLGFAGIAAIAFSALRYTETTPFPGYAAALPVLGTAAVILAVRHPLAGVSAALAVRPMQAIGRWSYSIYLWHWPMLIIPAAILGAELSLGMRLGLAVASIAAGALTYKLVEDPIRRNAFLSAKAWRSLVLSAVLVIAGAAAGAGLILGARAVLNTNGGSDTPVPAPSPAPSASSERETALEAAATPPAPVPGNLTPPLLDPKGDLPVVYADRCHGEFSDTEFNDCVYGDRQGKQAIFLVGDSHAAQWFDPMDAIAQENNLRLVSLTKSACPFITTTLPSPINPGGDYTECNIWNDAVATRIAEETPALVVVAGQRDILRDRYDGLTEMLQRITSNGQKVLVLGDVARQDVDVPVCLSENLDNALACAVPTEKGLDPVSTEAMRAAALAAGATFEPTAPWLCAEQLCPVVVGNILMYRDASHLTPPAALWLRPTLEPVVLNQLGGNASAAPATANN